jgi:2-iminobutanoate/2-iminopropanoate deaminase
MSKVITAPNAPAAVGPYSHAIDCGEYVFLSGQVPLVPETGLLAEGGIIEQGKQMFANIQAVLAAAGLDFSNVVKTTVFMTDLADFTTFNELYATYFPNDPPARSCVQVAALPKGALVETEVIAKRG